MIATRDVPPPFEAYSGEEHYAFVSYAHADKQLVYESMVWLRDNGVNIWYDEGIPPAGEWVEEIATAIKGARLFLVFLTPHAVDSRYVRNEVGYAMSLGKDILSVYLRETDLPAGLDLCLQPYQSIRSLEDEWKLKAKNAILDSFNKSSAQTVAFASPAKSIPSENLEPDLWLAWDEVREAQRKRTKREIPEKVEDPVPVAKDPSEDPESLPREKVPPKMPESVVTARTSRKPISGTRIPVALEAKVEPAPDQEAARMEPHEDPRGVVFSWIPAGNLTVWVPYANDCRLGEIKEGFWMSSLLVTQDNYMRIMGVNPSHVEQNVDFMTQDELPANNVSWLDAVSYGKAMTNLAKQNNDLPKGYEYRLPSEVEWEYACRAGTSSDYYFGDNPAELGKHAWFKDNSGKHIHPVGLKQANPWGLHDMYGNIREWVGTSFQNALLGDSEQDEFRISRGGGYMKPASDCQSSSRSTNSLYHRFRNLGFRIVLAKFPDS